MADVEQCAAILLAAGLSRRFGGEDKLLASYRGRPLIDYAASAIEAAPFGRRVAVTRANATELAHRLKAFGFEIVINADTDEGLASSIRLGIAAAAGHDAALIALGDMPMVPPKHLTTLCAGLTAASPIVASFGIGHPTAPAAFASSRFARLAKLAGDRGAQRLLAEAKRVPIDPKLLLDVDERQDLEAP